jgi:hypothetical protein
MKEASLQRARQEMKDDAKEQPTNALLVAARLGLLLGIFSGLRRR